MYFMFNISCVLTVILDIYIPLSMDNGFMKVHIILELGTT